MIEKQPYAITADILFLVERIGEAIGRAEAAGVSRDGRLRRANRIRTIRGSLAIEGNTLSEEEISTILDGKPVPDSDPLEIPVRQYSRRKSGPCSSGRLLQSHQAEFGGGSEYVIHCIHAGDYSGGPPGFRGERPSKRSGKRPGSTVDRRLADRFEIRCRTYEGNRIVASPYIS